jgi:hypothetical protein
MTRDAIKTPLRPYAAENPSPRLVFAGLPDPKKELVCYFKTDAQILYVLLPRISSTNASRQRGVSSDTVCRTYDGLDSLGPFLSLRMSAVSSEMVGALTLPACGALSLEAVFSLGRQLLLPASSLAVQTATFAGNL